MRTTLVLLALVTIAPLRAEGFSALAHQAVVDRAWDDAIAPALRERFPSTSAEELARAHAFAYGGSHIPDLGYFPLGSRLFTDLIHYVRSGDFIGAMLAGAETVDEYAFALGALSHYLADDTGHPEATNRVVAELYPELREKFGDSVTYADDHSSHLQTEFRFDVLQVARWKRPPGLYEHAIAFEVAKPVLERAFLRTYGLRLADVFANTDVAITTYRWAFREVLHEATGIAWELYRGEIQKGDPDTTPAGFVFDMSRGDFEERFGDGYDRPGYFTRASGFLASLVPNVGPLKRLPYKPLPEPAQQRFFHALDRASARYEIAVHDARLKRLRLRDETLDTGRPTNPGDYPPADEAYAELLAKLREHRFADVSPELRADILRFYSNGRALAAIDDDEQAEVREALAQLDAQRPETSRSSVPAPRPGAGRDS